MSVIQREVKIFMDNEEKSKLRDKQCYFGKWTDGDRREDPKPKNNIGSQNRGGWNAV